MRTFRHKKAPRIPKPYRSMFEYKLHKGPLKHLPFEPELIPYIIPAKYKPDFVNYDKQIIFEAKGFFQSSAERAKYVHFRKCNPEWTLIFIFQAPQKPLVHSKKRKDGTRPTHAEWAETNNFLWCTPTTIKKEWL